MRGASRCHSVVRRGQDFLGLPGGGEKAVHRRALAACECAVERITDDRHRAFGTEPLHDLVHADRAAEAFAFEVGTEVPERQRRFMFALQRLLGQQRRRAIDDAGLLPEIEAGPPRKSLQQQPALVQGAARDGELAPLEVSDVFDGRLRRHHHGAERAGRRIEHQAVAERALARDPQPVRQHQVGGAALERDLAGLGRRQLDRIDLQVELAVEPMRADDVEFPGERASALHRHADALRRGGIYGCQCRSHERGAEKVRNMLDPEHCRTMPQPLPDANAAAAPSAPNPKFALIVRQNPIANFGFKRGTKIIELLAGPWIPKFANEGAAQLMRTSESDH